MSEPRFYRVGFAESEEPDATQVLARTAEFSLSDSFAPQWEMEGRSRLVEALRRIIDPLTALVERDANEGDTRLLVTDFLCHGLNYDKYKDLTTEYQTKGESVDFGIRIDAKLFAFVEVKRCGQKLDIRSLRQVRANAATENVEWLVLTNGRNWRVYHAPVDNAGATELIIDIDLLDEGTVPVAIDALFHLGKDAVRNGRLEHLRRWRGALAASPLAEVLVSDPVIRAIHKELRGRTGHKGHEGDIEDVLSALREGIIPKSLRA